MKKIGADMLANLDQQLADGKIGQAEHDSRRIEIEEMIRTGKDVDMDAGERVGRAIGGILVWLLVAFAFGFLVPGPQPLPFIIGMLVGLWPALRIAHPRLR
ncbi:hypothetical protein V7G09_04900 [Cutibacterium avidum]|jgi:hypothetical protein|uniref:hypothetical protein n=1 Tax=Cutibacterium avidum TaxID=33010 RepID=UPI0020941CCF|nr:hypothetical protein [Cutibacterium avidum]MCO6684767.1 hypothetical protein [Cutibacterium avidum]MDU5809269.1 hypothetical protein [Finegoldia magna]MDU5841437.1 hypothetical protein [Cutibacterium avidum]MDU7429446.1 hypothetical protein [Cutibacterium avidum]